MKQNLFIERGTIMDDKTMEVCKELTKIQMFRDWVEQLIISEFEQSTESYREIVDGLTCDDPRIFIRRIVDAIKYTDRQRWDEIKEEILKRGEANAVDKDKD